MLLFLVVSGQQVVSPSFFCDFESTTSPVCGFLNLTVDGSPGGGPNLRWYRQQGETPSTFARTGPQGDYSQAGLGKGEELAEITEIMIGG